MADEGNYFVPSPAVKSGLRYETGITTASVTPTQTRKNPTEEYAVSPSGYVTLAEQTSDKRNSLSLEKPTISGNAYVTSVAFNATPTEKKISEKNSDEFPKKQNSGYVSVIAPVTSTRDSGTNVAPVVPKETHFEGMLPVEPMSRYVSAPSVSGENSYVNPSELTFSGGNSRYEPSSSTYSSSPSLSPIPLARSPHSHLEGAYAPMKDPETYIQDYEDEGEEEDEGEGEGEERSDDGILEEDEEVLSEDFSGGDDESMEEEGTCCCFWFSEFV
jgi:hypothetical protein